MTNEILLETSVENQSRFRIGSFIGWVTVTMTLLTALFTVWYYFERTTSLNLNSVCDTAQTVSALAAFLTAWNVSRNELLDTQTKKAWRILNFAFFSYFCGQALWFYYSSVLGEEPFPSVADLGYSCFYPLMLWGLRSFPTAPQTKIEKRNFWLDTMTVMVSGLVVVWHFIIRPSMSANEEPLKMALNLIYVVGDLILFLGIITILLKQPKTVSRRALYTLIAGMIAIAIADIGFAYLTLQNVSPTGTWSDACFTYGSYIFILAAYFQAADAPQYADEEKADLFQPPSLSWLPYAAVVAGYVMLLIISRPYWAEPLGAFILAAFVITGLIVLRQISSVRENLKLTAEQSSQKSELRLRSILENSSDITTIMSETSHYEYLSPAIEKFFGYDPEKLKGISMYEFVHPEDVPKLRECYRKFNGTRRQAIPLEYRFRHADGGWRDLDGIGQIIADEATGAKKVLINARDVTARKADELRLREYMKKLQMSNRELQDFAFVASHDLQEPLRKVQAFGDRLESRYSDRLGADGLDYLARMQSASHRMQTLITDLLTFSRVTTQAKPFTEFDLETILREVISDLEVKIEDTGAEISVEKLPKIEMDKTQMRQLFQNLLGNGLKFSKPGNSPQIKVWSEVHDSGEAHQVEILPEDFGGESAVPKGFCRIYVEDHGIGFDEKYLDRIFTVFQRLHGRTEYEGSGVGLAVCRKIVERHNGHLTAQSRQGEGAKFIITLPLFQFSHGEKNEQLTSLDNTVS